MPKLWIGKENPSAGGQLGTGWWRRDGVIREMYKHEAYVICAEDERIRAALVEISDLKSIQALNKMEAVGGGVKRGKEDH